MATAASSPRRRQRPLPARLSPGRRRQSLCRLESDSRRSQSASNEQPRAGRDTARHGGEIPWPSGSGLEVVLLLDSSPSPPPITDTRSRISQRLGTNQASVEIVDVSDYVY